MLKQMISLIPIINFRYVISAAHCANKDIVRLGEWNIVDPDQFDPVTCAYYNEVSQRKCRTSWECSIDREDCYYEDNANIDCSPTNRRLCAPEHQDIEISREIEHPDYSITDINSLTNDIMLLKLAKPAIFNDFVGPVCLPEL